VFVFVYLMYSKPSRVVYLLFSDRDGRTEREHIRQFREREEREHLVRKRNWLEVCTRSPRLLLYYHISVF